MALKEAVGEEVLANAAGVVTWLGSKCFVFGLGEGVGKVSFLSFFWFPLFRGGGACFGVEVSFLRLFYFIFLLQGFFVCFSVCDMDLRRV